MPVDPQAVTVKQVWYPSKDGTQVSMFLVHRRGLEKDGQRPVLLNGYGGFNVVMQPQFAVPPLVWIEGGGVYAMANLRGGAEYGLGDELVAGAAAQVAGDGLAHLGGCRIRVLGEDLAGPHQHAGGAVAALQPLLLRELVLQRVHLAAAA